MICREMGTLWRFLTPVRLLGHKTPLWVHFQVVLPIFLNSAVNLGKNRYFNFPNRKGYANTLNANIVKMYVNVCWFPTLWSSDVIHRGKILLAFEMRWNISKLWQAISSPKVNIFWCVFFLFFRIWRVDYNSRIKNGGKFWEEHSFKY